MTKWKWAINWFQAMSIGSLVTSGGFYLYKDEWKPLVWSAICVATIHVGVALGRMTDFDSKVERV